jgi:RNA polymerase sigma factor (sigma-70 family)
MSEEIFLARRFEAHRSHLRAVAYRMLGSRGEADDAVQEAWLRLSRFGIEGVDNLGGWMTTIVSRVCLDLLRTRKARGEELQGLQVPEAMMGLGTGSDVEEEAQWADSVGLALLVVLHTLAPAERVAYVLHDLFDLGFDEISAVVGRTPAAARQLASRARRRIQAPPADFTPERPRQHAVVKAFLAASRAGDFQGLLALLDPDVVLRVDSAVGAAGMATEVRGAAEVVKRALAYSARSPFTRIALVDGVVSMVVAPLGRLALVLQTQVVDGRITGIELIAAPERLRALSLALLAD